MPEPIEIEPEVDESDFREYLNDLYGEVDICGMTFDAGYALQELDPTAFRCSMSDYTSTLDSKWKCSECGTEYDDYDEAKECCQEEEETGEN